EVEHDIARRSVLPRLRAEREVQADRDLYRTSEACLLRQPSDLGLVALRLGGWVNDRARPALRDVALPVPICADGVGEHEDHAGSLERGRFSGGTPDPIQRRLQIPKSCSGHEMRPWPPSHAYSPLSKRTRREGRIHGAP